MIILCWSRAGGSRECRGHRVEDAGPGLAGATVRPGSRVRPEGRFLGSPGRWRRPSRPGGQPAARRTGAARPGLAPCGAGVPLTAVLPGGRRHAGGPRRGSAGAPRGAQVWARNSGVRPARAGVNPVNTGTLPAGPPGPPGQVGAASDAGAGRAGGTCPPGRRRGGRQLGGGRPGPRERPWCGPVRSAGPDLRRAGSGATRVR
jgi:hypothetical protein